MDNETEVIKHQMEETRTALTEKLEALEEKVESSVKDTTEAVAETVEKVKEAVESTVESVTTPVREAVESVEEVFDFRRQIELRPWLTLAGGVVAGYLGGLLLNRLAPPALDVGRLSASEGASRREPQTNGNGAAHYQAPAGPGWSDKLTSALAPALSKVAGLAIGATTGAIGHLVLESVPETFRQDARNVLDEITEALGGKPIHFPEREPEPEQRSASSSPSLERPVYRP
jgi:ElaB/YqjD/DUF883 family membrane-anchored ribosome-binding protein